MKKILLCFFCISVFIITTFNIYISNNILAEDNYYPDVPKIRSYNENQRLPHQKALYCYNKDINDDKHYVVYIFCYDYEILDGFTLPSDEIEQTIDMYFNQFQQYFENYLYEDYADKDTMLNVTRQMKSYLNSIQEDTGVKLFFYLGGMYCNLIETANDEYYASFNNVELSRLYFDLNISRDYIEGAIFVGE